MCRYNFHKYSRFSEPKRIGVACKSKHCKTSSSIHKQRSCQNFNQRHGHEYEYEYVPYSTMDVNVDDDT